MQIQLTKIDSKVFQTCLQCIRLGQSKDTWPEAVPCKADDTILKVGLMSSLMAFLEPIQ